MLNLIRDIVVSALLLTGCFFFLAGTIGVLRLPDVFTRLHPSTKCDTLGAGSVLTAMAIYSGWSGDIFRLAVIGFFLLISSATCGHAIGRSARKTGIHVFTLKDTGPAKNRKETNERPA
jgi:multicomponent Na+:H+ antiporter subunit G